VPRDEQHERDVELGGELHAVGLGHDNVGDQQIETSGRLARFARGVGQGLAGLRDPRRYLAAVASWQLGAWALRVACVFFFLRAFGIEASPTCALLVVAAQILSGVVPVAGGAGVQQALVVVVLAGHAGTGAAIAFSIGMQASIAATNVALAVCVALVAVPTVGVGGIRALLSRRAAPALS
jgi:hypothetical protein